VDWYHDEVAPAEVVAKGASSAHAAGTALPGYKSGRSASGMSAVQFENSFTRPDGPRKTEAGTSAD
jgi:hypothetical protein